MTRLVEEAMEKIKALPAEQQEHIAHLVLDEIESEKKWDELFQRKGRRIEKLADDALREHLSGQTKDLEDADFGDVD